MASAYSGKNQVAAHITDGTTDVVVNATGALVTMSEANHVVTQGSAFGASYLFTTKAALATADLRITVGTTSPHVAFACACDQAGNLSLYESAVLGTGTAVTIANRDRTAADTSGMTLGHSPTVTSVGNLLTSEEVWVGSGIGDSVLTRDMWKLKPSTTYLLRVTNISGTNANISLGVSGYI